MNLVSSGKRPVLLLGLCALLGASCGDKAGGIPTGFGVNITVTFSALPAATRAALTRVELHASGVERADRTLQKSDFDETGVARLRFIPTATTGAVQLEAEGFGAMDMRLAFGRAMEVTLTPNAVNVTVVLGPLAALGASCDTSEQCGSAGGCVDGVCCMVSSCGECRSCGPDGSCSVILKNVDDAPSCTGERSCDEVGDCKLKNGGMCTAVSASDCGSATCVDGVCCESACTGPCRDCNQTGKAGTCSVASLAEVTGCLIGVSGAMMCDPIGDCQLPHLITDVNTTLFAATTNTMPSSAAEFTLGPDGRIYFAATDGPGGRELWATDGTAAGTMRVLDIQPGNLSSNPRALINTGGVLYFKADAPSGKSLIYRSNGTPAGTGALRNDFVATGDELVAFGGNLYFAAADLNTGTELWKSDGSVAGTVQVKDIIAGGVGASPSRLTAAGNQLFFIAADQTTAVGANMVPANFEIWRTDGTSAGTRVTSDFIPGNTAFSGVLSMAALGNDLIFSANASSTLATELYKTDGTAAGTVLVKDINPLVGSDPSQITTVGNQVFFSAVVPTTGRELYRSDGTAAGTFLVKDIFPTGDASPSNLTAVGNQVFFSALDPMNGEELWRSDGTTLGTVMVAQIGPGATNSTPRNITAFGNRAFFSAIESLPGTRELWFTDGTPSGTAKACPPPGCMVFGNMASQGGRLWFSGATNSATIGDEPYVLP